MGHGTVQDKTYLDEISHYLSLLSRAKTILAEKPEYIDERIVLSSPPSLPPELVSILAELVWITDVKNAVRQVNQLDLRTREGY